MERFTDGLEKWVKQQKKQRQDISVVEFLAVKKDVAEAIQRGYSIKTIWSYLTERQQVRTSYETFRRHVKRFVKIQKTSQSVLAAKNQADVSDLKLHGKSESPQKMTKNDKPVKERLLPGSGVFKFDAKPNQEDLI